MYVVSFSFNSLTLSLPVIIRFDLCLGWFSYLVYLNCLDDLLFL